MPDKSVGYSSTWREASTQIRTADQGPGRTWIAYRPSERQATYECPFRYTSGNFWVGAEYPPEAMIFLLGRDVRTMAGRPQIRRTSGVFGGLLLILLGAWGALIPFVGPYIDFAYTPDRAWTYNTGRLTLEILPGGLAVLGGLLLLGSGSRAVKMLGAMAGVIAGAWFVVGNSLAPLWTNAAPAGVPASTGTLQRALEEIGFFGGLGAFMVLVAAVTLGRLSALGHTARSTADAAAMAGVPADAARVPADAAGLPAGSVPAQPFRAESSAPAESTAQSPGSTAQSPGSTAQSLGSDDPAHPAGGTSDTPPEIR